MTRLATAVTTIVPPEVARLDGTDVSVIGYMVPIDAEPEIRHVLLAELPADFRSALLLRVDEGLSFRDVAKVLGTTGPASRKTKPNKLVLSVANLGS